jgi:GNAT superfamily N-acetyltransferase
VDSAVDETIAWFKERNAPFFFWWTDDSTQPADLGERLVQRNLISMEEQQKELARGILQTAAGAPCMVADLLHMNEAALRQVPPGFTIEEIQDEQSLYDFKRIFVDVYSIPEWAGQAWVDAALSVGIGKTPWKMYLGRLDGMPVATNMLFTGGGIASVYAVATLASVRGKGIGGAITLQPLLEARDQGYRFGGLFASEMGVHAYERIGFRQTSGRINRYLWRNS